MDRVLKVILLCTITLCANFHRTFENEVVVRLIGGPKTAEVLAESMGYHYKGPVKGFRDTYIFIPNLLAHKFYQKRGMDVTKRLVDDDRVIWFEHQTVKQRQKRDYIDYYHPTLEEGSNGNFRNAKFWSRRLDDTFNDELWTQEWYLQDTRTLSDLPKLDLNVLPVYKAGITGKNIRISILDDGIEHTHDDLVDNYDPDISWDCNEDDSDPMPRYERTRSNSHGTRCAGEVAMVANNKKCGVGIAFNAKIGGVKLLDGLVNDRIEGTALGYAQHLVDIYSASWGPNDDGKTVDGPGTLAREALERGIREGRNGLGSIYVWASGNGGSKGDNCNCDGYLASPYTVSIGSASQRGEFPWYGEACASTLAVTYSSGAYTDQMIATTDLKNECTTKHTGTSASAPLAAGIIALALEVNPNLTWRDVQHIIVWTSELAPVSNNPGWQKNAAGFWFNTRFGFGLMNAYGLVQAAHNWTTVPEKSICVVEAFLITNNSITYGNPVHLQIETTSCEMTKKEVNYLEHVEVVANINYTLRGSLEIYLTSPSGTQVQLLSPRKLDRSNLGFQNWSFMSVMTWGENPAGVWDLIIADNTGPEGNFGTVDKIFLRFHGTKTIPKHMIFGPRKYNQNYNRVQNRVEDKVRYVDNYADFSDGNFLDNNVNSFEYDY